jgi:hypothetical protein
MRMDSGARVYADLLNSFTLYLSKADPALSQIALTQSLKALDESGIKYRLEGGALTVMDADRQGRNPLYDTILAYTLIFEREHGINKTWNSLKTLTLKTLQGNRQVIRDLDLEVPVVKYEMEYMLLETLFGFKPSDFRKRRWYKGGVLVTNHHLVFPKEVNQEAVPLSSIASLCREIYVGYSSEIARGSIRAIDYQGRVAGMSCAIILAKDELLGEFRKVVSILRTEYMRLSQNEVKVILALNRETQVGELPTACGLSPQDVDNAMNRLKELGYAGKGGRLTSYGINAVAMLEERQASI